MAGLPGDQAQKRVDDFAMPRKSVVDLATIVGLGGSTLIAAALMGTDTSWDLRNYHLYNGYALLHGRLGIDLAPAQLQTFYVPTVDAAYWLLLQALNRAPRVFNVVIAIPHAIAVCLSWAIARCFLDRFQAICAVAISATGAAMVSTLGTAMSEAPEASLTLAALWLLLRRPDRCIVAGLFAGVAVGLKLTSAPYAIGILAAGGTKRFLPLASGIALGALISCGWWWFTLWHHYGNPVFPYFNEIFRSPWIGANSLRDLRYMPHGFLQAFFYPFFWAFRGSKLISELPIRDPRIALGLLAIPLVWYRSARSPKPIGLHPGSRSINPLPLLTFFVISYVLWEAQFSIFRYLATLELVTGTLIVLAFRRLAPVIAVGVAVVTLYPHSHSLTSGEDEGMGWGRVPVGAEAVSVALPPIPAGSLVVLLDESPMAYVAAFAPPDLQFVGANNNLVHPGERTGFAAEVERTIRSHVGSVWGLESPQQNPDVPADATLRYYDLVRAPGCRPVESNLDNSTIFACPLVAQATSGSRTGRSPPNAPQ
jgi:hypothetical protein